MKISILSHNLSSNAIVRLYPIAKVLERKHQVQIIGPYFGDSLYPAYENEFKYFAFKGRGFARPFFLFQKTLAAVEGDIIYAFKPRLPSFGVGLVGKWRRKLPLILDIEDWDSRFWLTYLREASGMTEKLKYLIYCLRNPQSSLYASILERMTSFANKTTVATTFLQERFGGVKLIHGADTDIFSPLSYDRVALREKYDIPLSEKIILFSGNIAPHKGLEDLADAFELLENTNLKLLLVGGSRTPFYLQQLLTRFGNSVRYVGYQPHQLMPEFLAVADIVVIPQRHDLIAQAQIPGKLFEAMAMAKPLIVTRVSDLPNIVQDCGMVVDPNSPEQLAQAISIMLDDDVMATRMGFNARKKSEQFYSWNAMETTLEGILNGL